MIRSLSPEVPSALRESASASGLPTRSTSPMGFASALPPQRLQSGSSLSASPLRPNYRLSSSHSAQVLSSVPATAAEVDVTAQLQVLAVDAYQQVVLAKEAGQPEVLGASTTTISGANTINTSSAAPSLAPPSGTSTAEGVPSTSVPSAGVPTSVVRQASRGRVEVLPVCRLLSHSSSVTTLPAPLPVFRSAAVTEDDLAEAKWLRTLDAEVEGSSRALILEQQAKAAFGKALLLDALRLSSAESATPPPEPLDEAARPPAAQSPALVLTTQGGSVAASPEERGVANGPGVAVLTTGQLARAELDAARALFANLPGDNAAEGAQPAAAAAAPDGDEDRDGGWESEGDDEAYAVGTAPTGGSIPAARRPPLHFRPDVPRLTLPGPGVGTVGGMLNPHAPADAVEAVNLDDAAGPAPPGPPPGYIPPPRD